MNPYFSLLRSNRNFRLLFAGQTISVLGDRMVAVALAFAVLLIGGSPSDVGLVLAAQVLPSAATALAGGVLAEGDRVVGPQAQRAVVAGRLPGGGRQPQGAQGAALGGAENSTHGGAQDRGSGEDQPEAGRDRA